MSGRSFGYARVSTDDQNLALQLDALTKHGIPLSLTDRRLPQRYVQLVKEHMC